MKIYKIAHGQLFTKLVESFTKRLQHNKYNTNSPQRKALHRAYNLEKKINPNIGAERKNELLQQFFPINEEMIESLADDVTNEIDSMGVQYSIEALRGASAMAKNDMLVIGEHVFQYDYPKVLFTLFHELAHYYQYRKYGRDFALSVYTNDIAELEADVDKLLEIENTANRFGLMKARFYLKKYGLPEGNLQGAFDGAYASRAMVIHYVRQVKEIVEGMEPDDRTIDQINEHIYNMVA